jgi:hypothetical protein
VPSCAFVDTYYAPVLAHAAGALRGCKCYGDALKALMGLRFGTADFASRALAEAGWRTWDVVANSDPLRELWARENRMKFKRNRSEELSDRLLKERPDVAYFQNVKLLEPGYLQGLREAGIVLAGQCSYKVDDPSVLSGYDVVFTSFPHYVEIHSGRAETRYLALSFDPRATADLGEYERDLGASFVGGLGDRNIWSAGQDAVEAVAAAIPEFKWWGYGGDRVPEGSSLRRAWQGTAWGVDMYQVYLRSKIVVNRHGEVAAGRANNMRLFEATGCGALLLTEDAPNLPELFKPGEEVVAYRSRADLVAKIDYYLRNDSEREGVAEAGRRATLARHTFAERAPLVDRELRAAMERRGVKA